MIRIYAPASIGNIGVGFDVLGMAITPVNNSILGDYVSVVDSSSFSIKNTGCFKHQLPLKLEDNIVFQCWEEFCSQIDCNAYSPVSIHLEKNVPVSSGLGSSACSIVATLMAVNYHFGCPLNKNQLLTLMGKIEGKISKSIHFDNVSPCFLGGMQLIIQQHEIISQNIPDFKNWMWIVAYPGIALSTVESRSVLPSQYTRKDCIKHSRLLSSFLHACYTQQESLAIQSMQDIIAEPYRSQLLPVAMSYIRKVVIEKGAISCGIAGAGPTIFVLCHNIDGVIRDISDWLSSFYLQNSLGFIKLCKLDNFGARIATG